MAKQFPRPQTALQEIKRYFSKENVLTWRAAVTIDQLYAEMINAIAEKLREDRCNGCLINHPSQRPHSCLIISQGEAWNEFQDEAQQNIDPQEIISMTSEIIGCPLTSSWLKYVEALKKIAWWDHFATFRNMYRSTSKEERLIMEKVWQVIENRKNSFAPKQAQSVKGELLVCPFVDKKSAQPMQIDTSSGTPQPEAMDIDQQLSTDFANKLLIQ